MKHEGLIEKYLAGPEVLRRSVAGMSNGQRDARPLPFKWSARQVVLHIADCDLIYADHMKRVIAESEPTLHDGNRDSFVEHLAALPESQDSFRQVSHNPFLMAGGMMMHPEPLSWDELRKQAWESVEPIYLARLEGPSCTHCLTT